MFGDYPRVIKTNAGSRLPSFTKLQSEFVKGAIDFIGINHYYSVYVNDRPLKEGVRDYAADMSVYQRGSRTDPATSEYVPTVYPDDPQGLQCVLQYLTEAYGSLPIYVQENGKASANDILDDTDRVEYLKAYIGSTLDALRNGANVKGYFAWNFLDIFEFLAGYKIGFGMYRVDFDDEARPREARLSARWYSRFLKNNGISAQSEVDDTGHHAQQ